MRVSLIKRCWIAWKLLIGLRLHDFRAAGTFVKRMYPDQPFLRRSFRFGKWVMRQMFVVIPGALNGAAFDRPTSPTPYWLVERNPLANYPWANSPDSALPTSADVVVIGAGFTGSSLAYHWAKAEPSDKQMVVLDMGDPASGASGRNAGQVTMGRYYAMVWRTVVASLKQSRPDLTTAEQDILAKRFANVYCRAAYKNADLIESTIREEEFDCDYAREGWVEYYSESEQHLLDQSVLMGQESGFEDRIKLSPEIAANKTGGETGNPTAFSQGAGKFHPAKWVWSLLIRAIESPYVNLYCQTKVLSVRDAGEFYEVKTSRGVIHAGHIVNATEAYTPNLHKQFHDVILPKQTQLAAAMVQNLSLEPNISLSCSTGFMSRHNAHLLFGSDETRIPDHQAACNHPSRFITKYLIGMLRDFFGHFPLWVTNEWSGAVGFTRDEYPIVGVMDNKKQYIIAGMCGSGTAVSFNAARWTCNRILNIPEETDDYPAEFFSPTRLLDPNNHRWPAIEETISYANF